MTIQVFAHEIPAGPQGFPWVSYDVAAGDKFVTECTPDQARQLLEEHGLTENGARRVMHDARDYGKVKVDPAMQASIKPDHGKIR